MKINKERLGDVGIRLKPNEANLLENYTKFLKKTRKKKRKKKKIKKKTVKSIEFHKRKDPFLQIIEDSKKKDKKEIDVKERSDKEPDKESDKESEIKKIRVEKQPQDLSEKDPNVKNLVITASTKLEEKKRGSSIKLE
jgi:hypothetical protein